MNVNLEDQKDAILYALLRDQNKKISKMDLYIRIEIKISEYDFMEVRRFFWVFYDKSDFHVWERIS